MPGTRNVDEVHAIPYKVIDAMVHWDSLREGEGEGIVLGYT